MASTTPYTTAAIRDAQPTNTPPWRNRPQVQSGSRKTQNNRVDSWRSYKDDTSNLQTVANSPSGLNAAAPSFHPTSTGSLYKPYEPLRTSDGVKERSIVNKAKQTQRRERIPASTTGFAGRYSVRANRNQADEPLPSIEDANSGDSFHNDSLKQVLGDIRARGHRSTISQRRTPRQTESPAPPSFTKEYRDQASREPNTLTEARKLLVILDLNGTLLYRVRNGNKSKVHMRPGVTPLLDYLFNNHVVMVYTSTMPDTAIEMVSQFIHPLQRNKLAAIWARDKLGLTKKQYAAKVQVYKKLDKIWEDKAIQATAGHGNQWDQSNTILIDDSKLKALAEPHNLLQVLEYAKQDDPSKQCGKEKKAQKMKIQLDILKQLEMKLEVLKYQENVSRMIRKWQTGEVAVPRLPGQQVSVEENVDQKDMHEYIEISDSEQEGPGRSQLPTPVSIGDGDSVDLPLVISDDDDDNESGETLSGTSIPAQARASSQVIDIPGLGMLADNEGQEDSNGQRPQSRESSISESVFKELRGTGSK